MYIPVTSHKEVVEELVRVSKERQRRIYSERERDLLSLVNKSCGCCPWRDDNRGGIEEERC